MNNIPPPMNMGMPSQMGLRPGHLAPLTHENPNPLCITYVNPAFPANMITPENVLSYFCDPNNTMFYDRQSDNEYLRMQNTLLQGSGNIEALLAKMNGTQYVLYKGRPPLYVIRKQRRINSQQVHPLCYYYVLNGVVYQAPDLYSVVCSRIVGAVEPLKNALASTIEMAQYNPTKGVYSWKFGTEPTKKTTSNKNETADEQPETAEQNEDSLNSRATPYQHIRTEMLLRLLCEQFADHMPNYDRPLSSAAHSSGTPMPGSSLPPPVGSAIDSPAPFSVGAAASVLAETPLSSVQANAAMELPPILPQPTAADGSLATDALQRFRMHVKLEPNQEMDVDTPARS